MSLILACWRLKQEDCEFKTCLDYITRPLKNQSKANISCLVAQLAGVRVCGQFDCAVHKGLKNSSSVEFLPDSQRSGIPHTLSPLKVCHLLWFAGCDVGNNTGAERLLSPRETLSSIPSSVGVRGAAGVKDKKVKRCDGSHL